MKTAWLFERILDGRGSMLGESERNVSLVVFFSSRGCTRDRCNPWRCWHVVTSESTGFHR